MDLIDDDGPDGESGPGDNTHEFTVSEISGAVKRVVEGEFAHVRVRGEVGRVSRPRSGHVYLDLKDDRSVLSGVIWKGVAGRLPTQPEEGLEVIATGRLTTFPGQSKYQMVIEDIRPAGAGALMAMLEERKKKLAAEGLFDPARKRPIPFLPEIIGVVTSPSGAVIRDILHRLRDRFPRKVLVWPVAVQGAKCAPEVVRAIEGFNALTPGGPLPRPDLIIVARGGGSIEDLWGFNEESVARAAAASGIPLISAVGHETDTTLIDYVSDYRAPTPTAAAERAVPVRLDLLAWVDQQDARLTRAMTQATGQRRQRMMDLARALPRPETLVATAAQRLDLWGERLPRALIAVTRDKRVALADAAAALRPATLRRGLVDRRQAVGGLSARLAPALVRTLADGKRRLDDRARGLRLSVIERDTARKRGDLDRLAARLATAGRAQTGGWRDRLEALERLRQTLGYTETLKRGYAVVRAGDGVVTRKADAEVQGALEIEFADGRLGVIPGGGGAAGGKPKKPKAPPPEQGSLL
ncbi:exodeoxyribonuclease VII large subunit [Anianabacter salinae]|uniref:exodeoxyribonuclease VII large subunit n=1 Tax=Anianabacter salinae TaxID=2851023 RepID=UPI00225DD330|nr:exodeoxyribonuclease VII large subunit [Anianabacter salinae]MBV0913994.1 exodeoxyribonuclease VII large subunit [Anianabacter salinae]